jgi:hypothetical protein
MKPGEYIGKDGKIRCADGITALPNAWLYPTHPDFPAAVAAFQSLISKLWSESRHHG